MEKNVLYTPGGQGGKSSSADLIVLLEDSDWAIQCKAEKNPITLSDVADEFYKAHWGRREEKNFTFMVVATHIAKGEFEKAKNIEKVVDPADGKTLLSYRIRAGYELNFSLSFFNNERNVYIGLKVLKKNQVSFCLPEGCEIVILSNAGLAHFLTLPNLNLIMNPAYRSTLILEAAKQCMTAQKFSKQNWDPMVE
jgi:hypothetical protein